MNSPNILTSHSVKPYKFVLMYKYLPLSFELHLKPAVLPCGIDAFEIQRALSSPFPSALSPILMLKFDSFTPQQSP